MGEFVRLDVDARTCVATMRIERPPMNALSLQVWREIHEVATEAADRDDVRAMVVTGGPKVFAAGADIKEFATWTADAVPGIATVLQRSLDTLARVPLVTIAAVNGYALGGGCELALACDFRFVAEGAKFGQPEILLGLIPGAGGTQRLPRLIGLSRAKEMILTGRMVDATEALRIGLADAVHPVDEVEHAAVEAATRYASGPAATALAKRALEDGTEQSLDQGLRLESTLFAACFSTEDARTGIASFIENGPGEARFSGR